MQCFHLLSSYSARWNNFGIELGISVNDREILHRDITRAADGKLEFVIHKWIESKCTPVTWDNLIEILDGMGYTAIVEMIKG